MPRNGSGTFNRLYSWEQDAANNIKIRADRMDAEMDGMATALTNSIAVDGQTPSVYQRSLGIVTPQMFGAVGDGTTDDTVAFQSAADSGGRIHVPDGTYSVDPFTITTADTVFYGGRAAVLRWRTLPSGSTTLIEITGDRSGLKGLTLDGNKSSFAGNIQALEIWNLVNFINSTGFVCDGVRFQNHVHRGLLINRSEDGRAVDLFFENLAQSMVAKDCHRSIFKSHFSKNISNDGEPVYGHAWIVRFSDYCDISDIAVEDYTPDEEHLDSPSGIMIDFLDVNYSTFSGLRAANAISPTQNTKGVRWQSCKGVAASNVTVLGVQEGTLILNSTGTLNSVSLDGVNFVGVGLRIRAGSVYPPDNVDIATNSRANSANKDFTITGMRATRFTNGGILQGSISIGDSAFNGNLSNGLRLNDVNAPGQMPGAPIQAVHDIRLDGVDAKYNGQGGFTFASGHGVTIVGGDQSNNGQDTTATTNDRGGLVASNGNDLNYLSINGAVANDTQDFTETDGISFEPGSTDANNRIVVTAVKNAKLNIGQRINLINGTGSGDVAGRVVDRRLDEHTIEITGGATLGETGNTTTLTGTFTSSGSTITGTGSILETEITGRIWLTDGTEWRQVRKVDSNTSMLIFGEFSTPLSSDNLDILLIDFDGIPSQQYGLYLDGSVTGPVDIDMVARGNVTEDFWIDGVTYPSGRYSDAVTLQQGGLQVWNAETLTAFTSAVADASSGGNEATPVINNCSYVTFGPLVLVTGEITNIDTTGLTSGNDLFLTGLPFSTPAGGLYKFNGAATVTQAGPTDVITDIQNGDDFITFRDADHVRLTVGDLTSGSSDIRFTLIYVRSI